MKVFTSIVQGFLAVACLSDEVYATSTKRYTKVTRPQAHVRNGTYEGINLPNFGVDVFMGMRFAQAPTGDLRFRQPKHLNSKWKGVAQATSLPNICPQAPVKTQNGTKMDEDCLALNIFKPSGNIKGLPVVIWIHGGAYQSVSAIIKTPYKTQ
jgi:carboxylesterase type B